MLHVATVESPEAGAPPRQAQAAAGVGALGGITAANAVAVACVTVAGLLVVRFLPQVEYGRVASLYGAAQLIGLVLGLGLTTRVAGDLARARAIGDRREATRVVGTLLAVRLATLLPAPLLGVAAATFTGDPLYVLAAAVPTVQMLTDFALGVHQGLQRTLPVALGILAPAALYVGGVAVVHPDTAEGVFLVQIGSAVATVAVLAAAAAGAGLGRPRVAWLSVSYARAAVSGAGLIYAGVLAQMAFGLAALAALGTLQQFTAAADLGVALNLVRLPLLALAPLIVSLYYPMLCARATDPDMRGRYETWFRTWARGCLGVAAAVTAFLLVWPEGPIIVLATERYLHAAPLVRLLSPLVVCLICDTLITNTLWGVNAAGSALAVAAVRLLALALLGAVALAASATAGAVAALVSAAMTLAGLLGLALHVRQLGRTTGWTLPWAATLRAAVGAGLVVAAGRGVMAAASTESAAVVLALAVAITGTVALGAALALMGLTCTSVRRHAAATQRTGG